MRALLAILALTAMADAQPLKSAPPQDPNELSPQDGLIALHFFEHFMDVLKGSTDCPTIASRINFVIDRNRELIRLMAVATAQGKKIPKAVQDKMQARMMKDLMPVLQLCVSDPDVMAALERFQPRKPQPPIN